MIGRLRWRRIATVVMAVCAATVYTAAIPMPVCAATPAGFSNNRLVIVSEPDYQNGYVAYYKDDTVCKWKDLEWVDGKVGMAVALNGDGAHFRLDGPQTRLVQMTLAGWIYWKGDIAEQPGSAMNQRIFTISGGKRNYLTLQAHVRDESVQKPEGILNGLRMRFVYRTDDEVVDGFKGIPADSGITYALPQNEWHHFAVTCSGKALSLYIDGKLYYEEALLMNVFELTANSMHIGSGIWGDPTLHALLDEVALYSTSMTASQVKRLANGLDPFKDSGTTAGQSEQKEPHIPTAPPTTVPTTALPTTAASTESTRLNTGTAFGIPPFGLYIMGATVAGFALLSCALSVVARKKGTRPEEEPL